MILTLYSDESAKDQKLIVLGGYMATTAEWKKITKRWSKVLSDYRVKFFHFREFNSKDHCAETVSPYYNWSDKKRDSFFYDLGMSIGQEAVPIGGDCWLEEHRRLGVKGDPYEILFNTYFTDVKLAAARHFPSMKGGLSDKILFICDVNTNEKWTAAFRGVHCAQMHTEPRFGELAFEDDKNPDHCGLQVADYIAAIYRQNAEVKRKNGVQRKPRIIDYIVFRNLDDPQQKGFNFSKVSQPSFELIIEAFRQDEKRQKRKWEKSGITGKQYYPAEHIGTLIPLAEKLMPNRMGKLMQ